MYMMRMARYIPSLLAVHCVCIIFSPESFSLSECEMQTCS